MFKKKKFIFFILLLISLILILELISTIVINFISSDKARITKEKLIISELYKDINFEIYLKDSKTFGNNILYDPYRGFKNPPNFTSKHINTDEYGRRKNSNTIFNKEPDVVIGMFGGSTTYGIGAEDDSSTIASLLEKIININCKKFSTRVINNGVGAYNQTQSMIWLIETLGFQKYDHVIFYDFVNESYSAYSELFNTSLNDPELPPRFLTYQYLYKIPPQFTKPTVFKIAKYFKKTNTHQFLKLAYIKLKNFYLTKKDEKILKKETNSLQQIKINKLLKNYLENMRVINALAENYNFKSHFIMQPTLNTKKILSYNEKTIPHLKNFDYISFEKNVYKQAKDLLKNEENFYDFSNVFKDYKSTIYIDDHHMSSKGNFFVAEKIFKELKFNFESCN